jgi:hypothetical protein
VTPEDPEDVRRPRVAPPGEQTEDEKAAAARIKFQSSWVDLQLRQAIDRGDFEQLPGYGKPIKDLTGDHDPDWWVKRLVEREKITGVLPPSLQMRKEDALLDDQLDRLGTAAEVRREVREFNERVRWALYRPPEGPPMITQQRDPDTEVARWESRRAGRIAARAARRDAHTAASSPRRRRRRWWSPRRGDA